MPGKNYSAEKYAFVSYSRADSDVVLPIINNLIGRGYDIWYDERIPLGVNFADELIRRIKDCSVFLLFVSASSIASPNVDSEVQHAIAYTRPALRINVDDTSAIPYSWSFLIPPTREYVSVKDRAHLFTNKLIDALNIHLGYASHADTTEDIPVPSRKNTRTGAKTALVLFVFLLAAAGIFLLFPRGKNLAADNPGTSASVSATETEDIPQADDEADEEGDSDTSPEVGNEASPPPAKPVFNTYSASSYIDNGSREYGDFRAFDGNYATSWQEYTDGSGIGQWISCSASSPQCVSSVGIVPGNCDNEIAYSYNGRPTRVSISLDGEQHILEIADRYRETSTLTLDSPVYCSTVTITILDAVDGDRWSDTAICEIIIE